MICLHWLWTHIWITHLRNHLKRHHLIKFRITFYMLKVIASNGLWFVSADRILLFYESVSTFQAKNSFFFGADVMDDSLRVTALSLVFLLCPTPHRPALIVISMMSFITQLKHTVVHMFLTPICRQGEILPLNLLKRIFFRSLSDFLKVFQRCFFSISNTFALVFHPILIFVEE